MTSANGKNGVKPLHLGKDITLMMGNTFYAITFAFILRVFLISLRDNDWQKCDDYNIVCCIFIFLLILYFFIDWVDTNLSAYFDKTIGYFDIGLRLLGALVLVCIISLVIKRQFRLALYFSITYNILAPIIRKHQMKEATKQAKEGGEIDGFHRLKRVQSWGWLVITISGAMAFMTVYYVLEYYEKTSAFSRHWPIRDNIPLPGDWKINAPIVFLSVLWLIALFYKGLRSRYYLVPEYQKAREQEKKCC